MTSLYDIIIDFTLLSVSSSDSTGSVSSTGSTGSGSVSSIVV